jgi:hypothetical protein
MPKGKKVDWIGCMKSYEEELNGNEANPNGVKIESANGAEITSGKNLVNISCDGFVKQTLQIATLEVAI